MAIPCHAIQNKHSTKALLPTNLMITPQQPQSSFHSPTRVMHQRSKWWVKCTSSETVLNGVPKRLFTSVSLRRIRELRERL